MHAPEQHTDPWRTSSYSATDNGCVEVAWRTSSHSTDNGDCVEVAWQSPATLVRDSKSPTTGTLTPERAAWHTLLHSLR